MQPEGMESRLEAIERRIQEERSEMEQMRLKRIEDKKKLLALEVKMQELYPISQEEKMRQVKAIWKNPV